MFGRVGAKVPETVSPLKNESERMTKVEKFETLRDFEGIIAGLDDYARLPLFAEDEFGRFEGRRPDGTINQRIHGIVNLSKRSVTMACGREYPVFGHKEAYGLVIRDLKDKQIEIHGKVETIGDRTKATILFNELRVIKDDKDGVELGISFKNPMDRKTSFKGNGYTWRQFCSNGAGVKTLLPQLEINEQHTSTMLHRLPAIVRQFVDESLKQTNVLQTMVTKSMEQKVVFESREQFEATMSLEFDGIAEKHMKAVMSNLKSLEPTRWELFNATTYYTSHSAVSMDVQDRIDDVAERFLNITRPINPVPIIRRRLLEEE
jgi:hypothetical protein